MIDRHMPDIDAWVAFFTQAELPVLRHTARQLAELRAAAQRSNARRIASAILHDPMMTLRVRNVKLAVDLCRRSGTPLGQWLG